MTRTHQRHVVRTDLILPPLHFRPTQVHVVPINDNTPPPTTVTHSQPPNSALANETIPDKTMAFPAAFQNPDFIGEPLCILPRLHETSASAMR